MKKIKRIHKIIIYIAIGIVYGVIMFGIIIPFIFNMKNDITPIISIILFFVTLIILSTVIWLVYKQIKKIL